MRHTERVTNLCFLRLTENQSFARWCSLAETHFVLTMIHKELEPCKHAGVSGKGGALPEVHVHTQNIVL